MLKRREFLKSAGGIAAGGLIAPAAISLGLNQLPEVDILVVDPSLQASTLVGLEAKKRGIEVLELTDVETLWYDRLKQPCCSAQVPVIAGLTDNFVALQMEMLVKDAFYYSVFRGNHRILANKMMHDLRLPAAFEQEAAIISSSDNAWPIQLCRTLFNVSDRVRTAMIDKKIDGYCASAQFEGELSSWVFAPMNRGRTDI